MSTRIPRLLVCASMLGITALAPSTAFAAGVPGTPVGTETAAEPQSGTAGTQSTRSGDTPDTITVTGWKLRSLDKESDAASRLGLAIREVPATIDQISSGEILTRGIRTVEEATDSLPGVTSGGSPGAPSEFSMRGFTAGQITVLHNGLYLGSALMVSRPGNTFNVESIDVLKGPASVLFGQGAIGGAVNIVNKDPDFNRDHYELMTSYATFETSSSGIGANKILSDKVAVNLQASYHRTSGFVHDAPSTSLNITGSLLFKPTDNLSIKILVDYLRDDLSPYYGTPLVPAAFAKDPIKGILTAADGSVIDGRMRFINYNVTDSKAHSDQIWPQISVDWQATEHVKLSATAYYFHADRQWLNAENYIFNPATNLIDRDRFVVFHKQAIAGGQVSATVKGSIFGLKNRLVAGIDYNHLNFTRTRGFPDGDSVDPLNPVRGLVGPFDSVVSPTRSDQIAFFAEDALDLVQGLKLVTGIRTERLYLTRENFDVNGNFEPDTSFKRTFKMFSWRAGLVYDILPRVSVYASYSTGKDPVGDDLFSIDANQSFNLASSRQYEAGLKADAFNGKASLTLSVYDIKRSNILTQLAQDQFTNIGSQMSRGVEMSGEAKITKNWTVTASGAYTDAKYGTFVDPNFGINASGNRPPNVPKYVAGLWTTFRHVASLPLELGGGVKYVGDRFANTANSVRLHGYTTAIAYATYEITPSISVTARANNLFNTTYAQWADIGYPHQVMLGEPRRLELSILGRF